MLSGSTIRHLILGSLLTFHAAPAHAVGLEQLRGSIRGQVRSTQGQPQLGAVVTLYNRLERELARVMTDDKGNFTFPTLNPDRYSIKVTIPSFVPALKRSIAVQPGMQSLVNVRLSTVFSTVELTSTVPQPSMMMSDDWKWALRSSDATRPVLRFQDEQRAAGQLRDPKPDLHRRDAQSMVRVSGGDLGPFAAGGSPDLGTGFTLVTPVEGAGDLRFSGNVGYVADSGSPVAAFRTSWQRSNGATLHMTARQLLRPNREFGGGTPALRMISLGSYDKLRLSDELTVEYGGAAESAFFMDKLIYLSAFARATYQLSKDSEILAAFSNGSAPLDLLLNRDPENAAQNDLTALNVLPRFSRAGDRTRVQQSRNWELGYRRRIGSRTLALSAHREEISDTAAMLAGDDAPWDSNMLQDMASSNLIANLGRYRSQGFIGSITQRLGEQFETTLAFGNSGVLTMREQHLEAESSELLRSKVTMRMRKWASLRAQGVAPLLGTRFTASYQWTEARAITPTHVYLTQNLPTEAGLNVRLRQPVPRMFGLPGRLEATCELRNMLGEGYLRMRLPQDRSFLLIHSPRAVRGGLALVF